MEKKIYQVEVNDPVEGWIIPNGLYSWQVFHTYEEAENWALKNLSSNEEVEIKEYNPEDIEDYVYVNPKYKEFKVFDIEWDVDEWDIDHADEADLPEKIELIITEDDVDNLDDNDDIEEFIEDYLSDKYGYCHYGFQYDELEA